MDAKTPAVTGRAVVVIPAYAAAATLPAVLRRIPRATYDALHAVVIVEDGGPDVPRSTTPELLREFPKAQVVFHEHNRGYGGAQKTGFRRALELGADFIVLLHADGQYAPEIMPDLLAPLQSGAADLVLGSRMKDRQAALAGGMPYYKYLANIALTHLENRVSGLHLSEFHSGYMLYSRRALEAIPFEKLSDTFHFDGEMLLVGAKKGLRIADVAIPTHYGDEKSHLRPIPYGLQVLRTVWKYWRGGYDF